jgi:hypothetical protein
MKPQQLRAKSRMKKPLEADRSWDVKSADGGRTAHEKGYQGRAAARLQLALDRAQRDQVNGLANQNRDHTSVEARCSRDSGTRHGDARPQRRASQRPRSCGAGCGGPTVAQRKEELLLEGITQIGTKSREHR